MAKQRPNGVSAADIASKLDKVSITPQTVAGAVMFEKSITVPSASVILGEDGARIGSSARAFAFTDARERNTLFSQYYYDDTGGTVLEYWNIGVRATSNICPDSAVTLSDPQELAFSGAGGNALTRAFSIIPMEAGTLRVQSWEGADDTGAVLIDTLFEIGAGVLSLVTMVEIPIGVISETGDMQFVRFSGIPLAGSLSQSSGLFIGQECPYLDIDVHVLTKVTVPTQAGLGYTLVWGANMQTTGRYAQVNGITGGSQETGLSPGSEYPVSADGTLDCLSYSTDTGDATTVFKILKNGTVVHTFTATGASGFEEDIGLSVSRAAGDKIAIEYDAGMKPAGSVYIAYID